MILQDSHYLETVQVGLADNGTKYSKPTVTLHLPEHTGSVLLYDTPLQHGEPQTMTVIYSDHESAVWTGFGADGRAHLCFLWHQLEASAKGGRSASMRVQ